ncbi:MAG: hypothetical protein AAGF12_39395, partial [Myxococcota bacterium]
PNSSHSAMVDMPWDELPEGVVDLYGVLRRSLGAAFLAIATLNLWTLADFLRSLGSRLGGMALANIVLWLCLSWSNVLGDRYGLAAANVLLVVLLFVAVALAQRGVLQRNTTPRHEAEPAGEENPR